MPAMKGSHRDTLVVAAIAGGCGIIGGAALTGPWQSLAELLSKPWFYGWAAVWATAAVGFGAFYYAREAHKLRKDEISRHEDRMRDASIATFNLLQHALASRVVPHFTISIGIQGAGLERLSSRGLFLLAQSVLAAIPTEAMPLGSLPLTEAEISKLGALDTNSRLLRHSVEALIAQNSYFSDKRPSQASIDMIQEIAKMAKVVADDAHEVRDMIAKYRPVKP